MKKCTKCGGSFPSTSEYFAIERRADSGLSSWCRKCKSKGTKEWRERNREQVLEYSREYREKNPEGVAVAQKAWREANPEWRKEYKKKNKKKIILQARRYYKKNEERIKKYREEYKRINKEKIARKAREYRKRTNAHNTKRVRERRKTDIQFRLKGNLRHRLNEAMRGRTKSASTMTLIGCTGAELKKHLEKQFLVGMSWGNYGRTGWHIDHIIPCASYDLTDPEQQRQCFNYRNLQPLWASDNIRKGSKHWDGSVMRLTDPPGRMVAV